MNKPLLIIAAGGTGGHMFPAQALAEAMLARGWEVHLSTDARGARYAGAFPQAVRRDVLASATFARGGALAKLMVPLRIGAGVLRATLSMLARRPTAVVGFGGYPSIPALSAAWALRVPRMLHEQNGVLGKVNSVFAPRVTRLACGTWPTALPQGVEGTPTGNPVRAAVLAQAGAPYEAPGETGPLRLVMIGGSQGARILSQTVPAALALLPETLKSRIEIAHQARPEDAEAVTAAYEAAGITADVQSFLDVPALFARAHLVISRAGASSLADLTVIGRPGILVPYAVAAGDHQTANARGLIEAGAAVMLPEPDFTPERLCDEIVSILQQPDRAAQMAHSAKGLGRPDATDRLVALVDEISGQTEKQ